MQTIKKFPSIMESKISTPPSQNSFEHVVHIFTYRFPNIYFNIIISSTRRSSKCCLSSFRVSNKNYVWIFPPRVLHDLPSHLSWFHYPDNTTALRNYTEPQQPNERTSCSVL